MKITTLDFETEAIEGNPLLNPPKPVGLAIRNSDGTSAYLTDWGQMKLAFEQALEAGPVLFQNAPFDLSVARTHLDIPWPHWSKVHDTMYLLYLHDPYARSYSLKPSAERVLGIPPDERDELRDWILANVHEAKESNWGAFICRGPVELVAKYAIADTNLTFQLFDYLIEEIPQRPYDLERELMPFIVAATIKGIRVDREGLEQGAETYSAAFAQADDMLRRHLNSPNLNPGSSAQLAEALIREDMLTELVYTPTGKVSTAKKNLVIKDPYLMNLLNYRSTLKTLLGTFFNPWLEFSAADGRVHPNWNSTRGDRDGGTRTGRLSSNQPNFQNVPNPASIEPIKDLPDLPEMRKFVLPEVGHLWLKRDFSAQEIRVMAHFEDGALAAAFRDNPMLDPHEMVRQAILTLTGTDYPRKYVKETGFGILYGMGVGTLAERIGCDSKTASGLVAAYKKAIPGVEALQGGTRRRGRSGMPITTWGGRLIYCEPPKVVKGAMRSFEYKLLNYLIQGSSADQTKTCLLAWEEMRNPGDVFMATVHDEINISAEVGKAKESMELLRRAMEEVCEFDVPMKSEGFIGKTWGDVADE